MSAQEALREAVQAIDGHLLHPGGTEREPDDTWFQCRNHTANCMRRAVQREAHLRRLHGIAGSDVNATPGVAADATLVRVSWLLDLRTTWRSWLGQVDAHDGTCLGPTAPTWTRHTPPAGMGPAYALRALVEKKLQRCNLPGSVHLHGSFKQPWAAEQQLHTNTAPPVPSLWRSPVLDQSTEGLAPHHCAEPVQDSHAPVKKPARSPPSTSSTPRDQEKEEVPSCSVASSEVYCG
ncbi:hypothetical protein F4604DRAFT_1918582 [Suillus subluteus]|nr:hypothetical protein F4604DRAFT_1918582 [Suillus subluteus]